MSAEDPKFTPWQRSSSSMSSSSERRSSMRVTRSAVVRGKYRDGRVEFRGTQPRKTRTRAA